MCQRSRRGGRRRGQARRGSVGSSSGHRRSAVEFRGGMTAGIRVLGFLDLVCDPSGPSRRYRTGLHDLLRLVRMLQYWTHSVQRGYRHEPFFTQPGLVRCNVVRPTPVVFRRTPLLVEENSSFFFCPLVDCRAYRLVEPHLLRGWQHGGGRYENTLYDVRILVARRLTRRIVTLGAAV